MDIFLNFGVWSAGIYENMSGESAWNGNSAQDDARQHNGNVYGNIHNNYNQGHGIPHVKPKPPSDGSYERGVISAAKMGSVKRTERYLRYDVNLDFAGEDGRTALHWAVGRGHEAIARMLIEACCNIDYESEECGTPLCAAAIGMKTNLARLLLEEDANPNAACGRYGSALHLACSLDSLEMVLLLLEYSADVKVVRTLRTPRADGRTRYFATAPLNVAIGVGNADIVAALMSAGADVNAQSAVSEQPFPKGHEKWKRIPSNLNIKDARVGVAGVAVCSPLLIAVILGHKDCAELLLAKGANVDKKGSLGYTAIFSARDGALVRLLVSHGAQMDDRGNWNDGSGGYSPLLYAASQGWNSAVEALLDLGAPKDAVRFDGWNAYDVAKLQRHEETAELLHRRGVRPSTSESRVKAIERWHRLGRR